MAKIIPGMVRNEEGILQKAPGETLVPSLSIAQPSIDVSIDDLLKKGLLGIERAIKHLLESITAGNVDREVIGCLKDCMTMLHELKRKEKEILDSLTDEQLDKLLKDSK